MKDTIKYGDTIRYGDGYAFGVYDFGFALYKDGEYVIDGTQIKSKGSISIYPNRLPTPTNTYNMTDRRVDKRVYQLISKSLEDRVKTLEDILAAQRHLDISTSKTLEERVAYLEHHFI